MKRILVPLTGDAGDRPALDLAGALAKRRKAHVDAVLFRRDPRDMIPLVGEGFNAAMIESMIEAGEQQAAEREKAAAATYKAWQGAAGLPDGSDGGLPSASFSAVTATLPTGIAGPARAADLTVFGPVSPEYGQERAGMVEVAMFDSGRPVLLAPAGAVQEVGRHVLVGWNGSAEAARAVAMAMPLLATAERVTVLVVEDGGDDPANSDDLVRTLSLSGIKATGKTVGALSAGVTATLEAEAKAAGADMILLGAYSHSRFRQFILGGVTSDVLAGGAFAVMLAR